MVALLKADGPISGPARWAVLWPVPVGVGSALPDHDAKTACNSVNQIVGRKYPSLRIKHFLIARAFVLYVSLSRLATVSSTRNCSVTCS